MNIVQTNRGCSIGSVNDALHLVCEGLLGSECGRRIALNGHARSELTVFVIKLLRGTNRNRAVVGSIGLCLAATADAAQFDTDAAVFNNDLAVDAVDDCRCVFTARRTHGHAVGVLGNDGAVVHQGALIHAHSAILPRFAFLAGRYINRGSVCRRCIFIIEPHARSSGTSTITRYPQRSVFEFEIVGEAKKRSLSVCFQHKRRLRFQVIGSLGGVVDSNIVAIFGRCLHISRSSHSRAGNRSDGGGNNSLRAFGLNARCGFVHHHESTAGLREDHFEITIHS